MKRLLLLLLTSCSHPTPEAPKPEPVCTAIEGMDLTWRCMIDGQEYICMKTLTGYGYECWSPEVLGVDAGEAR